MVSDCHLSSLTCRGYSSHPDAASVYNQDIYMDFELKGHTLNAATFTQI